MAGPQAGPGRGKIPSLYCSLFFRIPGLYFSGYHVWPEAQPIIFPSGWASSSQPWASINPCYAVGLIAWILFVCQPKKLAVVKLSTTKDYLTGLYIKTRANGRFATPVDQCGQSEPAGVHGGCRFFHCQLSSNL